MAGGVEFQQGYWAPISHKAIDILSECDGSVIKVYHVLLKMASGIDRNCWPSVATIAEEGNVSTRCVTRAISTLEEKGLIKVKRRYSDNQGTLTNMYLITSDMKKEGEEFQDAPGCTTCRLPLTQNVKGDDAGVLQGMTRESNKQELIEQDSIRQEYKESKDSRAFALEIDEPEERETAKSQYSEKFNQFWSIYSKYKPVGKLAASKKFESVIRSTSFSKIMDGLKAQEPDFQRRERQFVPNASTWLNQGRWEDEVTTKQIGQPVNEWDIEV